MAMYDDPVLLHEWHPVASLRQLSEKPILGVRLFGEDLVIWSANGKLHAWQDLCVHRGARLSLGGIDGDGHLQCPYHGWIYNGEGRCVHIPALADFVPGERAQVKTYAVRAAYDLIWVCPGEPQRDIPPFPEWQDGAFRKMLCGPYRVSANGFRLIENFLDVAHFPFVHTRILGVPSHPLIADYEAAILPEGFVEARGVSVYQPDPYGTGQGDTVTYTYRAYRPLSAYLLKESNGPKFSILLTITPHDGADISAWMWMAMNYGHDMPERDLIAWQDGIFNQDKPVVESQRPQALPLDPQAELSVRCDRSAVVYRRWLKELGVRFGVL
ncbi:MAG: aromatic ring-hydroxylating dioxygenase subunit alpha [Gammaproteobacteria bacterium]